MAIRYDFQISDLLLRVESQKQLQIPDSFLPFHMNNTPALDPDILIQIVFDTACMASDEDVRKLSEHEFPFIKKFYWHNGEYIIRKEGAGRGQPCRLFIPPSFAEIFCDRGKWLNYLAMERMLIPFNRIILHASAVIYQGKAYLFSAPSGGGKSTHAALWQNYYGAKLLNGDKVVIHPGPHGAIAYGSPVAGSSGIYCNESAPIAAIILLQKGTDNRITTISPRTSLFALYSEAIKCNSDPAFNTRLLDIIEILQRQIPILSLECLPERGAVDCVLQYTERITI